MLCPTVLLFRIALIQNGKLDYFSLASLVALLVAVGVWLWQLGLDLVRSARRGPRLGGAALLAVAGAYSLLLVGLAYWEMELLGLFS
ncbi:MAG: hypothetical protein ACRYG7_43060 [Janthinobacterium lividum]